MRKSGLVFKRCIANKDNRSAHSRGGLVTFVATKVTKKAVSRNASFAAPGLYPANQAKPGTQKFRAIALLAHAPRFSKTCFSPAAAQATIVLPDFIRSCSADGKRKDIFRCKRYEINPNQKRVKA